MSYTIDEREAEAKKIRSFI